MQPPAGAETDRAASVAPAIRPTASWRVAAATVLPMLSLHLTFVDGTEGDVSLAPFLRQPAVDGTPFEALRDASYFSQVQIAMGTVTWPNTAELAPDALYDAVKAGVPWPPA